MQPSDTQFIYPWQEGLWQQIMGMRTRLPHSILLQGKSGIGKFAFSQALARALLCDDLQNGVVPCGRCTSCHWCLQGTHPDLRLLRTETIADDSTEGVGQGIRQKELTGQITIAQVRGLSDFINLTTHRKGLRVILIYPAEAMNINSANALLKILEEPPEDTLFILVSHQAWRLLPTIKSRCHTVNMVAPSLQQAREWLEEQGVAAPEICLAQAGYAPLDALDFAETGALEKRNEFLRHIANPSALDPVLLAEGNKLAPAMVAGIMQKWLYDLLSLRMGGEIRYHPDFTIELQMLLGSIGLMRLLRCQRDVQAVQKALRHPLNPQMLVEQLLFMYKGIFA